MSFTADKKKWELYCQTHGWVETGEITGIPTECPIESNHTINVDTVHIIQDGIVPELVLDDTRSFILKKQGDSLTHYYGSRSDEIHISQHGQGDYTSVKAALEAHTNENIIFIVHPGTYLENNPLVLNRGCSIRSHGSAANTTIVGINPTQPVITLNNMCELFNICIAGAAGPGGCGVYYDGTGLGAEFSFCSQLIIVDCFYGVRVDGGTNKLIMMNSSISHINATTYKAIYLTNGADMNSVSCIILGSPLKRIPEAISLDNGSSIHAVISSIKYPDVGIMLDDGAEFDSSECFITNPNVGVKMGNTSTSTTLIANNLDIRNSNTYDLCLEPDNATVVIKGGRLNVSKIHNPNSIKLNAIYNAEEHGKAFNVLTGDLNIGAIKEPSKLQIGEGKYSMEDVYVLHNDNIESGEWVDISADANSFEGSLFELFPSEAANSCVYIGSEYPILGFKAHVTTDGQINDVNDVVWEYGSTGNAWTQTTYMNTICQEPYYTSNKQFFESDSKHHIRFGLTKISPFEKRVLNGIEKYWIRGRIVNDMSGVPELEYLKMHTSNSKINNDGWLEYYGDARPVDRLPWSINMASPANSSPGNRDLYLGDNLGVGRIENLFENTKIDRLGLNSYLPQNIDTSFPIKLRWSYTGNSNTTNNIRWVVRWGFTNDFDSVYDTTSQSPTIAASENSIEVISVVPNGQSDKQLNETAKLDISHCQPRPDTNNPDIVWITLERTGNHSSDTYTGHIAIIQLNVEYVKWCEGGHLHAF